MDLNNLFKCIELDLRSDGKLSRVTWDQLSFINDWEFRICEGFIRDVNLAIQKNDLNLQYKKWDFNSHKPIFNGGHIDLLIATIKRDQKDIVLCDVTNRLVIPEGVAYDKIEVWGMGYVEGRNFCVKRALEIGASYLLFIDDDMIVENTALVKLWETMQKTHRLVVSANYQKKADYEVSAHGKLTEYINGMGNKEQDENGEPFLFETDLCAMGFTLINIKNLSYNVPSPIFWAFNAPDGLWAMGEDAFFTKNLYHYTKEVPIIDTRPSILHYDKLWKKCFGKRNKDVTYATNGIDTFSTFDYVRQSPLNPLINICIPVRDKKDAISTDLSKLLCLRGFRVGKGLYENGGLIEGPLIVDSLPVDQARNTLAVDAVKSGSTYMLFLDNDIIMPGDGLISMLEVLENDKDHKIGMVCGDYLLKGKIPHSVHLVLNEDGMVTEFNRCANTESTPSCNWLCGLGCALIRTEVFRQLKYPWFQCYSVKNKELDINSNNGVSEDGHFCELLFEAGYDIKIMKDIKCVHVDFKNYKMYGYNDIFNKSYYTCFSWVDQFKYIPVTEISSDFETSKRN